MGVSVSTSLSKLKENPILLKFVDNSPIVDSDDFWNKLLSFSYTPPKSMYVKSMAANIIIIYDISVNTLNFLSLYALYPRHNLGIKHEG